MTNNFFRQLCYSIEQQYWKRYLDEYEQYGEAAMSTRKRWEEWQVADDITKQMLDALNSTREDPEEELYCELEDAIANISPDYILEQISEERFVRWCDAWRKDAYHIIANLQKPIKGAQEAPADETIHKG